jgi:hypothetical protein
VLLELKHADSNGQKRPPLCALILCKEQTSHKNQCIREKTGAENIVKEIKQYQEKWLQHIRRMGTNRISKQALQYKPKDEDT